MKISIAMATYNGARYLWEQLESFENQIQQPDELVVCDDRSSDETIDILEKFSKTASFPVRIHLNPESLGCAQNFARAITLCQGEFIFLSDQDDVWVPEKIVSISEVFSENPDAGYVFSDAKLVDENLAPFGALWEHVGFSGEKFDNYVNGQQIESIICGGPFIYGNSLAFRSCFRELILPIVSSPVFTHDTWTSLLLSATGNKGVALPEKLLFYRQHVEQVVGAGRKKSLKEQWHGMREGKRWPFDRKVMSVLALRDRAQASADIDAICLLDHYIVHLEARASISTTSFGKKLSTIFAELKSGRYTRFSSSWKSALTDLLLVKLLVKKHR